MHVRITGFGLSLVDDDYPRLVIVGVSALIVLLNIASCRAYGRRQLRRGEHVD